MSGLFRVVIKLINYTPVKRALPRVLTRAHLRLQSQGPHQAVLRVGRKTKSGAGPKSRPARISPVGDALEHQDTFNALSSSTKEVCSEESSVPVNFSVMVWPMYEARL